METITRADAGHSGADAGAGAWVEAAKDWGSTAARRVRKGSPMVLRINAIAVTFGSGIERSSSYMASGVPGSGFLLKDCTS
jgi:hypothetical protein